MHAATSYYKLRYPKAYSISSNMIYVGGASPIPRPMRACIRIASRAIATFIAV